MAKIPVTEGYYVDDATERGTIERDGIAPDEYVADTVVLFRELDDAKDWASGMAERATPSASGALVCVWRVDASGLGGE